MSQSQPSVPIASDLFAEAMRRAQAEFREMPGRSAVPDAHARHLSADLNLLA
jgi:hypothetical protein